MELPNQKNFQYLTIVLFISFLILTAALNYNNLYTAFCNLKTEVSNNDGDLKTELLNLDNEYSENFAAKNHYVNINGAFSNLLNISFVNNVLKLDNGHLITIREEVDVTESVEKTVMMRNYLQTQEIPYMYIQLPTRYLTDDDYNIPMWVETYDNSNINKLLKGLQNNNIPVMDIRQEMQNSEIDSYNAFYKTDHHWKIETALWSHTLIAKNIMAQIGNVDELNQKALDLNNYTYLVYEDVFLGSTGQRTGFLFAGGDDATKVIPNFETNLNVQIPTKGIEKEGDFEEAILDFYGRMDYEAKYDKWAYTAFSLSSSDDYVKITNSLVDNDYKVFIIKDSFAIALVPFLALHFSEIHMYDPRYGDANPDFLLDLITKIEPDIVVSVLNQGAIGADEFYNVLPWEKLSMDF